MCGGACVSWFSRTQRYVTQSTTEPDCNGRDDQGSALSEADKVFHEVFPFFIRRGLHYAVHRAGVAVEHA